MLNKYSLYQILFFGFLVVGLVGVALWIWHEQRQYAKTGVLTVGLIKGRPIGSPTDMVEGFNWDVAHFIAGKLNKQLKIKRIALDDFVSSLQNEEIDVFCASMIMTEERLKDVAMIHLYGKPNPNISFVFLKAEYKDMVKDVQHIKDLENFFEKRFIGVIKDTVWEQQLKKYNFAQVKTYECELDAVKALNQGDVAAIVLGALCVDFLEKQNSNVWTLRVALDAPYGYGVGVSVKKGRKELIKQVADAVRELKSEGMIILLQLKWFGNMF